MGVGISGVRRISEGRQDFAIDLGVYKTAIHGTREGSSNRLSLHIQRLRVTYDTILL